MHGHGKQVFSLQHDNGTNDGKSPQNERVCIPHGNILFKDFHTSIKFKIFKFMHTIQKRHWSYAQSTIIVIFMQKYTLP